MFKKNGLSLLLIVVVLLTVVQFASVAATTKVIPDRTLETAILKQLKLNKATVTTTDLAKLKKLVAENLNIKNIQGLQYAKYLTDLDLSGNLIADLTPLRSLSNLVTLDVESNKIRNIDALANKKLLVDLNVNNNRLTNLSVLSTSKALDSIQAVNNQLTSLSGLYDFQGTYADFSDNRITELRVEN